MHLQKEILNSRNDMHEFWIIIKTLTPQKSNTNVPKVVEVVTVKITESKQIAEKFNEHVCKIGKKSERIDGSGLSKHRF